MTNEPNNGEEVQEEVIDNGEVKDNAEGADKPKGELTAEQKRGIAKRNLKKYRKEHPDLFENEEEKEVETKKVEKNDSELPQSQDELILLTKIGKEKFAKAQHIALINGTDVVTAHSSEDFELWEKGEAERKRKADSELERSGGGKGSRVAKLGDKDLSREDHQRLEAEYLAKM